MKDDTRTSSLILLTIVLSAGFTTITYTQTAYSLNFGGIDLTKIPGLERALEKITTVLPSKDVKIAITAKVSDVDDRANILGESVKVGDTITVQYIYNPTIKDTNTDETVGDYQHNKKPYGITLKVGDLVFKTDPNNVDFLVELVNRDMQDNYLLRSYNNLPLATGFPVSHIAWQLDDQTGKALSSDSLKKTPTPPVLNKWSSIFGLTIEGEDRDRDNSFFIRAHVDSAKLIR